VIVAVRPSADTLTFTDLGMVSDQRPLISLAARAISSAAARIGFPPAPSRGSKI
jgi:hypothetical protein